MPRMVKELKKIRKLRIKNRRCYDCNKKLPRGYKRTRCRNCLKKEKSREHRRIRKDRYIQSLKHVKDMLENQTKFFDELIKEETVKRLTK